MSFEDTIRQIVREELSAIIKAEFDRRSVGEKPDDDFLDTDLAAEYLKVDPAWLRTLVREGRVTAFKAPNSGRWKFKKSDLDDYLINGRKEKTLVPKTAGSKSFLELNKRHHKQKTNA